MSATSPNRPRNELELAQTINGSPVFLGVLTSTAAAAVSNTTTAVPFNVKPTTGYAGSLAGKALLLQSTADCVILPWTTTTVVVAQQSSTPSATVVPGVLIGANERVEITMGQDQAYLQFRAVSGNATLLVWEMV